MTSPNFPNDADESEKISSDQGIQRRDFLKVAGIATTIAAKSVFGDRDASASGNSEHNEHSQNLPAWLDIGTAAAIAGNFGRHVIWNNAVKGKPHALGARSAIEMNGLALGRIAALKALGGKEGAGLAKTELSHLAADMIPVPILVALSDATTTELKVNAGKIFEHIEGALEKNMDYSRVQRPGLDADEAVWSDHLEKTNQDLQQKVAQIAAITSVVAPVGTTYSASALANQMKEDVLRMLYEQSFAMAVIDRKKKGAQELFQEEVHEAATQRATELFNGKYGYSKLMMTLAANTQGSWGIGDPPEIYFAMKHAKSPETLAIGHAFGAVNSEFYTMLMNALWMKKAGILSATNLVDFLKGQLKTVQELLKSAVPGSRLASVSFNNGSQFAKKIIELASKEGEIPQAELGNILTSIPQARIQFPIVNWLKKKKAILENLLTKGGERIQQILPILENPETFADIEMPGGIAGAFTGENTTETRRRLDIIEDRLQDGKASHLASLFEGMIDQAAELSQDSSLDSLAPQEAQVIEYTTSEQERAQQIANAVNSALRPFNGLSRTERLQKAEHTLDNGRNGREIYEALSHSDESTIHRAIQNLTAVQGKEDIIPGMDEGAVPGESIADALRHVKMPEKKPFLSHSADEVLWALGTQIPSVPALSRLALLGIPAIVGVQQGSKPTISQIKNGMTVLIPTVSGGSGLADNVAAYIFGESVGGDLLKQGFGDDVLEKRWGILGGAVTLPIGGVIAIAAVKNAENAGNLTQVGNGPNFSQEDIIILADKSNSQGISLDRVKQTMGDTLPHKNMFATMVNGTFCLGSILYLRNMIDRLHEQQVAAQAQETQEPSSLANIQRRKFLRFLPA